MYETIEEIKRANKAAGYFWFSPATMRCFHTIVYPTVYGGRYFVTSDRDDWTPRHYSVRRAYPSGDVLTVNGFSRYATKAQATKEAQRLAALPEEPTEE